MGMLVVYVSEYRTCCRRREGGEGSVLGRTTSGTDGTAVWGRR